MAAALAVLTGGEEFVRAESQLFVLQLEITNWFSKSVRLQSGYRELIWLVPEASIVNSSKSALSRIAQNGLGWGWGWGWGWLTES